MFFLIDKPKGFSSHDVVNRLRKITGVKRVGHGGTLDPNATGLLVVAVGRESTKKLGSLLLNSDKTYEAEITLGANTDTDDSTGKKTKEFSKLIPPTKEIQLALFSFVGKFKQTPPQFSAKKIHGRSAYKYAVSGTKVHLKSKPIEIYSITVKKIKYPKVEFSVKVSSGSYIRSLARDLGKKLGTGGYLENLRRIKIGDFDISDSVKLDVLNANNWKDYELKDIKITDLKK